MDVGEGDCAGGACCFLFVRGERVSHSKTGEGFPYLFDPDLAVLALGVRVFRVADVVILGQVGRGAAAAGAVVEEHGIPLFGVSEGRMKA